MILPIFFPHDNEEISPSVAIFFLLSACDSAADEKTSLRGVTGSVVESGKNQVDEIKSQTKEATDGIKEGVTNVKTAAKEIEEAEDAVGKVLGEGE